MLTTFDEVFRYDEVQAFFRKYETLLPGTVANHFLSSARLVGEDASPEQVLRCLLQRKDYTGEHAKAIADNHELALLCADYYIMWSKLGREDRKAIQELRFLNTFPPTASAQT